MALNPDLSLLLGNAFLGGAPGDIAGSMSTASRMLYEMRQAEEERRLLEEQRIREEEERKARAEERDLRMQMLRGQIEDLKIAREAAQADLDYADSFEGLREQAMPDVEKIRQEAFERGEKLHKENVRQWERAQDRTYNEQRDKLMFGPKPGDGDDDLEPSQRRLILNNLLSSTLKQLEDLATDRNTAASYKQQDRVESIEAQMAPLRERARRIESELEKMIGLSSDYPATSTASPSSAAVASTSTNPPWAPRGIPHLMEVLKKSVAVDGPERTLAGLISRGVPKEEAAALVQSAMGEVSRNKGSSSRFSINEGLTDWLGETIEPWLSR